MTSQDGEPIPEATPVTESNSTRPKRSRFGVFLKWMLIVFAVMQLVMQTVWEPSVGPAIVNLITFSQALLSSICILIWWFFFSSFSRRTVLSIGLPVVACLAVWLGSIESIDLSGDMVMSPRYYWQKSPDEQLAEFRENAQTASTDVIENVETFSPEDMPAYRGINRDGVVVGPPLRTDWEANPPTELWRHPIGGGYSSFSIVHPVAVTMEQRDQDEVITCYELETGLEFWEHRYPAYFTAIGGPGPRSTPTIHNGAVYSFGCYGDLFCLDLKTGTPRWHVNVLQQFSLPTATWGMTASPLIHENLVIVNIGGLKDDSKSALDQPGNGLVAYNLESGNFAWKSEGLPNPNQELATFKTGAEAIAGITGLTLPGYSSPMLATLADREVILNFDGVAFRGHDPATGSQLWKFPYIAGDYINVAQPIVFDKDRVLISSGYGTGTAMLQISRQDDTWSVEEIWTTKRLRSKFSSPILYDGYIYGLDEGIMVCINPEDGSRLWKGRREGLRGRYGHGQMLLVEKHILVLTESGELVLIEPSPQELIVTGILQVLSGETKTWNPISIAHGKAVVRNAVEVACYDISLTKPSTPVESVANSAPNDE